MKRKLWLLTLLLCLPLLGVVGCSDDDDGTTDPDPGVITGGTLSGVVTTASGAPLVGVTATTPGANGVQTNEDGVFRMSGLEARETVATFTLADHMTTHQNVRIISNQTTHLPGVVLVPFETAVIDAAGGGTAVTADGEGRVTFPANAFELADGTPYTGDVNVEFLAMLPTEPGYFGVFPGRFEGLREDETVVPFVSFGFMDVELMDNSKAVPVRLADGVTAELQLRAPATEFTTKQLPSTMPMWYYDPAAGMWIEDGEATLVGDRYVADVSHFTTWNWDLPLEDVCMIEGTVRDLAGLPVENARVIAEGLNTAILDDDYTDAEGHFSVRGIVSATFRVRAIKGSYSSDPVDVTLTQCPYTLTEDLELLEPAFSIALTWGEAPSDLDSHLFIPATWTTELERYHLAYYREGTLTEDPYTALDTDDTSSFGPEIISGFQFYNGTYSYYVHNYSGNTSHPLVQSGAQVTLELGGQTRVFNVSSATGSHDLEWWHVFNFTYDNAQIAVQSVNAFTGDPDPDDKSVSQLK
ncbi:MAG: carboxypeptidase regulatory-like domain-containing protein [Candidatus Krumholzibacteriia bacterium]